MRILSSILLILVLLSKTAYGLFWQVNFRMNQREIARLECENKNRPEMHCNGQCYLAKKLKAAEEKEQKSTSERLEKMPEVVLSFQSIQPVFTAQFIPAIVVENHFTVSGFFPNAAANGFFHPPQV